jgi:excisionase family DNA binding protein
MDEHSVLTLSEAASVLRLSRTLTYELAARGELPSLRFRRRIMIPPGRNSANSRRLPGHFPPPA